MVEEFCARLDRIYMYTRYLDTVHQTPCAYIQNVAVATFGDRGVLMQRATKHARTEKGAASEFIILLNIQSAHR